MPTSNLVRTPAAEGAARRWAHRLGPWLGSWRGMMILGGLLVAAGLYAGWGWLTAVGLAPIILALAPCAAMCAIGACAMSRGGSGCAKPAAEQKIEPPATSTTER
jgi:hypothetical protein